MIKLLCRKILIKPFYYSHVILFYYKYSHPFNPQFFWMVYIILFCCRLPTIFGAAYQPYLALPPTFRDSIFLIHTWIIFPPLFSEMIYVPSPLFPIPHSVGLVVTIFPSSYLYFGLSYPPLPIYFLMMTWHQLHRRRTYICSTFLRKFEECLNKAGNHTWRNRSENEKQKPAPWKYIYCRYGDTRFAIYSCGLNLLVSR